MSKRIVFKYLFPFITLVLMGVGARMVDTRKLDIPYFHQAEIQYTHLAITENLEKGNGTLLSPKTYLLDPVGGGKNTVKDGSTDARFPVLHKIIACLPLSGIEEKTAVWRIVSFCFFLIAIYFSSLLAYDLTNNWVLTAVTTLGVNLTAVLFFAQSMVGPQTFIYALLISGLYFSFKFIKDRYLGLGVLAVLLLGVAGVQGHGSIFYLVVFLGILIFSSYRNGSWDKIFFVTLATGFFFISIYTYNRLILFSQYGGVLEVFDSLAVYGENVIEKNSHYIDKQGGNVTSLFTSVALFAGLFLVVYNFIKRKVSTFKESRFFILIIITFTIQIIYYLCFVSGMLERDVYMLESYYPAAAALSIFSVAKIWNEHVVSGWKIIVGFTIVLIASGYLLQRPFYEKFNELKEDRIQNTFKNFSGAKEFLDNLNVSKDEKITLINGYGGNMALMLTGRSGYATDGSRAKDFKKVLEHKDSKYVLSQDQFFMFDVVNSYPEALGKIELVASNENLTLYKKVDRKTTGSVLKDFVISHKRKNYFEAGTGFESTPADSLPGSWSFSGSIEEGNSANGRSSMYVPKDVPYPCTFRIKYEEFDNFSPVSAIVTGNLFSKEELWKVCFTLSVHRGDKDLYLNNYKVSKKLKGSALGKWSRVACKITLPEGMQKGDEIRVFLWNPDKGYLFLDDFSVVFY